MLIRLVSGGRQRAGTATECGGNREYKLREAGISEPPVLPPPPKLTISLSKVAPSSTPHSGLYEGRRPSRMTFPVYSMRLCKCC